MIFEVRHVGFNNKGSELMLYAILQQIKKWNDSHIICADLKTGSFSQRSHLDIYHLLLAEFKKFPQFSELFPEFSSTIPRNFRRRFNLVLTSEVEIVIDASGFSYSDQWETTFIADLLDYTRKCYYEGKKTIFLPQAFGPFNNTNNIKNMTKVIEYSDLIFARDRTSYNYLINLVGESSKIRISPDFTNLVEGIAPNEYSNFDKRVCIVPNARMLDKTQEIKREIYLNFLQRISEYLYLRDYEILLIIHEDSDYLLGRELISNSNFPAKLIKENDPRIIKGIIGQSALLVGSRYHAIVSSLSQGIPTIGTSWSHKYDALFEEYDCKEYLIKDFEDGLDIDSLLIPLTNEPARSKLIDRIRHASSIQKEYSINMWEEIYDYVFND